MSVETAEAILYIATVVAAVVWLIGLWFLVASSRVRTSSELPPDHFGHVEQLPSHWVLGSVEVDGQPDALVDKAASMLVRQNPAAVRISEKTKDRFAFEWLGPVPIVTMGAARGGQLRFAALGSGRSRIDYAVEPPARLWLLRLGALFQVCGLIALVAGYWLISEYCVPSADPRIRAQSVQIVQVIHFLWPPFLFGGLYRHSQRGAKGFEVLLRNLTFFTG